MRDVIREDCKHDADFGPTPGGLDQVGHRALLLPGPVPAAEKRQKDAFQSRGPVFFQKSRFELVKLEKAAKGKLVPKQTGRKCPIYAGLQSLVNQCQILYYDFLGL